MLLEVGGRGRGWATDAEIVSKVECLSFAIRAYGMAVTSFCCGKAPDAEAGVPPILRPQHFGTVREGPRPRGPINGRFRNRNQLWGVQRGAVSATLHTKPVGQLQKLTRPERVGVAGVGGDADIVM